MADNPVPLCSAADFELGAFADLASATSPEALADFLAEATRLCEDETERRLAPFTGLTETHRADGIDPDEYAESANLPMDIQGTLGWSYAQALGTTALVRHCWLHEFPARYADLWSYSDVTVEIIRSYGGTEELAATQILDGPDDTGHVWFQLGLFLPLGSRVRVTYSGGYNPVPASLQRACKLMTAWLIIRELNPEESDHDPEQLHEDALMALSNWGRT